MKKRLWLSCVFAFALPFLLARAGDWRSVLGAMPAGTNSVRIHKTAPMELVFQTFQANPTVRAVIFLPAATDELYFFDHGVATLTGAQTSLADVLEAMTNQGPFRLTFRDPFLLVHMDRDRLEPALVVKPGRSSGFDTNLWTGNFIDMPWERLQPALKESLGWSVSPGAKAREGWHFSRVCLAARGLTAGESAVAVCLAAGIQGELRKHTAKFGPLKPASQNSR